MDFSGMEASVRATVARADAAIAERRAREAAADEVLVPECYRKSCLSYWFPKIDALAAGDLAGKLFVPKTVVIRARRTLIDLLDGESAPNDIKAEANRISGEIKDAADRFGYPAFLRTGQGSGKHLWKDTCFLADGLDIHRRMVNLIEWGEMAGTPGEAALPANVWVVREFLKGDIGFTAYTWQMPVAREFRVITRDGQLEHIQPYWAAKNIEDPSDPDWLTKLADHYRMDEATQARLGELSSQIACAIGDDWSMDWFYVPAEDRWYLTDMAPADDSHQWEGRPNDTPSLPAPRPSFYASKIGGYLKDGKFIVS